MQYVADKYQTGVQIMPDGIDTLVEKIGAQLGAVEEVIDLGKKYQGVVVAKIVKCVKHPNADKLNVCTIDDGGNTPDVNRDENGLVQVVCGAPNAREGLLVVWLPPGSTVPSMADKDPFVLEARDLRGVVSNGMLASPHELALSDSHEGILEIEEDAKPGDSLANVYGLDDYIIDIENKMFTHRPDCFGQLGVAREIAGITGQKFTSPDWYVSHQSSTSSHQSELLKVENQIPELCPRYMAVVIEGVKIGPSPMWLQSCLSRLGVRPINNIVDMTNYMMLLTGQPLHAFDFDKVAVDGKATIVVRSPHEGEQMTLLDGKTITPRKDAILIADQDKPIALGGVMGGGNSEIDEHTTRIIIECANFDMYNVRRTAMEHGIFTDAVTRFNKGQSEWQCPAVLSKAVSMTQELSPDAQQVGDTVDMHQPSRQNQAVNITSEFINQRLGLSLSTSDMSTLLTSVEFDVHTKGDNLTITAPFWRTDIEIPEDIVEEVGRLYGFDHLPLVLPQRSIQPAQKNSLLELKTQIRDVLSKAGANELLTYTFVHGNLLDKVGQDKEQAFKLSNALSPDLQYYRLSLTPSLLDKVHPNIKTRHGQFALFEFGKAHTKGQQDTTEPDVPKEVNALSLVVTAHEKAATSFAGAAYYEARKYLDYILESFGATGSIRLESLQDADLYNNPWLIQMTAPFEPGRSAILRDVSGVFPDTKGLIWGVVGEYRPSVAATLKLPAFTAGFELDPLLLISSSAMSYRPLSRFPRVEQDMSLKVAADTAYGTLGQIVQQAVQNLKPADTTADISLVDIFQKADDTSHKQTTLRLHIVSYERTLKAEEVNNLLDQVAAKAHESIGAERI
jgi:phenylalanyl-tRNA synthetase beta chain